MKHLVFGFSLLLAVLGALSPTAEAGAQTPSAAGQLEVQGLQISPFLFDKTLEKGQSFTETITLRNTTDTALPLNISINNFLPIGRHGEVRFVAANVTTDQHFALADWINITKQPEYLLNPRASTTVTFTVTAPVDADEGTHYGGIVLSFNDNSRTTGTKVTQSVGALIITKVGRADSRATAHFKVDKQVFTASPQTFTTLFENSGNTHLIPKGKIQIKNIFGHTVGLAYANPEAQIVLPQTTREFLSTYNSNQFMLGRYTADLTMTYGNPKLEFQKTIVFWVIPIKLLSIVATCTLAALLICYYIVKSYNKWIIKRSSRR